jgi:hypothetical protein
MANDQKDLKISLKIDVTKILKEALFAGKTGAKYLDATVYVKSEPDQYGNFGMITQDKTKDLTDNGKNQIIGNIKVWNNDDSKAKKNNATPVDAEDMGQSDDLPF